MLERVEIGVLNSGLGWKYNKHNVCEGNKVNVAVYPMLKVDSEDLLGHMVELSDSSGYMDVGLKECQLSNNQKRDIGIKDNSFMWVSMLTQICRYLIIYEPDHLARKPVIINVMYECLLSDASLKLISILARDYEADIYLCVKMGAKLNCCNEALLNAMSSLREDGVRYILDGVGGPSGENLIQFRNLFDGVYIKKPDTQEGFCLFYYRGDRITGVGGPVILKRSTMGSFSLVAYREGQ